MREDDVGLKLLQAAHEELQIAALIQELMRAAPESTVCTLVDLVENEFTESDKVNIRRRIRLRKALAERWLAEQEAGGRA